MVAGAPDVAEVGFKGWRMSKSYAQESAMAKAAEVTLERGYRYFSVAGGTDESEEFTEHVANTTTTTTPIGKKNSITTSSTTVTPVHVVIPDLTYTIRMYKTLEEIPAGTRYSDAEAVWSEYHEKYIRSPVREPLPKEWALGVNVAVGRGFFVENSRSDGGGNWRSFDPYTVGGTLLLEYPLFGGWVSVVPGVEVLGAFGKSRYSEATTLDGHTVDGPCETSAHVNIDVPALLRWNVWRLYLQTGAVVGIVPGVALEAIPFGLGYRLSHNLSFDLNFRIHGGWGRYEREAISIGATYMFDWFRRSN